jgi:hypothetical protein
MKFAAELFAFLLVVPVWGVKAFYSLQSLYDLFRDTL